MRNSRLRRLALVFVLAASLGASGCATIKNMFRSSSSGTSEATLANYGEGMALMNTGQYQKAAEQFHKAIKRDPGLYYAYYPLGRIYKIQGRPDKARPTWEMGLKQITETNQRKEYPGDRAAAEMRAALAGLESTANMQQLKPTPRPAPKAMRVYSPKPKPKPKPMVRPVAKKARPAAKPMARKKGPFAVAISTNNLLSSARGDVARLKKHGYRALITSNKGRDGKTKYRVWVGCCTTLKEARVWADRLKRKGVAKGPFVRRFGGNGVK